MQCGSAIAKTLFDDAGPGGVVALRIVFAALVLMLLWRPLVRGHSRADWVLVGLFGITLAGMNLCFYESLSRIPLGIAVTIEFCGPLGVAVAGSRRLLDGLWVVMAAGGIVLLAEGGGGVALAGILFALAAAAFWAAYILLSVRAGKAFPGGSGLALAMVCAAALVLPFGAIESGSDLLVPSVLAAGLGVALLSSAIPYSLELEALRRMPARVFGIFMSLEPAMAALAGFVILGESLSARQVVAIAAVAAASAGASLSSRPETPIDA
ncbi:MAG: inner rane transporter RhtA [Thermoleophilales bacterium]|nr:inner rane transporter RhtA [Thermoleophilales bacterium]